MAQRAAIDASSSDSRNPSRYELLSMVRKHSNLLGETIVNIQDASDIVMDPKFWLEMLDLYFIRGRVIKGRQEDDLVFFVKRKGLHGYGFNDDVEGDSPFFVRRWVPKLEKLLSGKSMDVDWRQSFYLNLIAHTSYRVTVAICSNQALQRHSREDAPLSPIYKVVKTVYASPSRINFHFDHKKDSETSPAYPNICFAVDDFDDTFDAVILSEKDHCYCVLLNAYDGAAFPPEKDLPDYSSTGPTNADDSERSKPSKITLFSGFVNYQMVREAYDAGKSRLGSLLGHSHTKTDRLFMRGPGGRGEVEVAVSGVADQSRGNTGSSSPLPLSRALSIGLGTIVHKAASAASEFAKHAYSATSSNRDPDLEILPLKCCLMSVTLPWEHIAHDLLFKVNPPVNL